MGLIKAAKESLGSLMADQWREYFYCDAMNSDTLMLRGYKRVKQGSSNHGQDNVISNGSIIAVNEGQCMLIVDQGKITEICAEPGEFLYDSSTEATLLYGKLGENVKSSFIQFGRRFTFGGDTPKEQRVYYINTKEILDNKYGTATPIPFHVVAAKTGFELETNIKCNGIFTFKIVDPVVFYTNIAANVDDRYARDTLLGTMKSELMTELPQALSRIGSEGILPSQIPNYMGEVTQYMQEALTQKWTELRGIAVISMSMSSPTVPQEDIDKINKWYGTAVLTNPGMSAARQTEAFTQALENMGGGGDGEGSNSSINGAMGMMGIAMMQNMMNGGMGGMFGAAQPQGQAPQKIYPASTVEEGAVLGWTCSCGKSDNRSKFCGECGLPKPVEDGWTCACGKVNKGNFCQECGRKKPVGAPMYRCDKCGWEPEDPTKPPKFCPECGDIFDDNDKI